MKLRSHETYWLLKNGLINTYPSLQKNLICDVLVIGGGITGALMVYQLSGEGYKTVLIDKRDVAMGSTGATTAMLQYEIDEPLCYLIDKVSERAAVDSYLEGILAIREIERIVKKIHANCGFKKKRSVYIADSEKNLQWLEQEFECRKKYKIEVSWLSKEKLKQNFGIAGEGAIVSKAGANLDAYRLAHALLKYSVSHHALQVFDHTTAERVEHNRGSNTVFTDSQFGITCRHLIYASGYEAQTMFNKSMVNLNSTYAFVSEPLSKIPTSLKNSIFWTTHDPYLYLRSTSDNRILVGGGDESFENAVKRDRLIDKKELFLLNSVKKLIPDLTLIPDFTWAGTFGVTQDSLPFIGPHPDYPNSYFVLGFGGNGITFSVMGMKIISDVLAGKVNKFLTYFSLTR